MATVSAMPPSNAVHRQLPSTDDGFATRCRLIRLTTATQHGDGIGAPPEGTPPHDLGVHRR
jgi:hypothetical protein